jgi:predicted DCC family thiol-disulfide oxidoreductase YuxK
MKLLTWLDWRGKLSLVPVSSPRASLLAPGIDRHDLLEAIHCVTGEGRIYRGARALRFVGLRLPLMVPVALILWIPGVIYVAERAYQFVSRHRLFFSKIFGCKGACAVMPTRVRSQDQ